MSSFNVHARKIRNSDLPMSCRYSSLRSCLWHLVGITNESSFLKVVELINERSGFRITKYPTEEQLLAALAEIEEEREAALAKINAFTQKRKREKAAGRSTASKRELDAFALSLKLPIKAALRDVE